MSDTHPYQVFAVHSTRGKIEIGEAEAMRGMRFLEIWIYGRPVTSREGFLSRAIEAAAVHLPDEKVHRLPAKLVAMPCMIHWIAAADHMPDADLTVLIHHPENDEPVWLGYHDGETWRDVDATRCKVSHWADLPRSPSAIEKDPFQSEEYQFFIAEMAKTCEADNGPCDSCLAGGSCDGPTRPNFDDEEFDSDAWCGNCDNLGTITCRCGGDLCVCENQGEIDCPACQP